MMMNFVEQLNALKVRVSETLSPVAIAQFEALILDLKQRDLASQVLACGDAIPEFTLPTLDGTPLSLAEVLAQGPAVLSFYRGTWCPFCTLELQGLGQALEAIASLGATVLAISPQITIRREADPVEQDSPLILLRDRGNHVAQQLGLLFQLPPAIQDFYTQAGVSLPRCNGDASFRLPIPATFIVNPAGRIVYRFVDVDYTQRLDPVELVTQLRRLRAMGELNSPAL